MCETGQKERPWRKVLYDNAGYPDNFTPPEYFLAARTYNQNLVVYTRGQCLAGAARVATQISDVIIFWCCYNYIKSGDIQPLTVLMLTLSLSLLGFLVTVLVVGPSIRQTAWAWQALKTTFLFVMTGYASSPVLHNLTESVSTDSVHTMAASSFLLHLVSSDYGAGAAPLVSWQLSLNAAVLSSVCLASRLDSHTAAFSLLSLSVLIFLLLPLARPLLSSSIPWSLLSCSFCLALLSTLSTTHTCLALALLLAVQFLCPLLFYRVQSSKLTIHGPWDEAVPATD